MCAWMNSWDIALISVAYMASQVILFHEVFLEKKKLN